MEDENPKYPLYQVAKPSGPKTNRGIRRSQLREQIKNYKKGHKTKGNDKPVSTLNVVPVNPPSTDVYPCRGCGKLMDSTRTGTLFGIKEDGTHFPLAEVDYCSSFCFSRCLQLKNKSIYIAPLGARSGIDYSAPKVDLLVDLTDKFEVEMVSNKKTS